MGVRSVNVSVYESVQGTGVRIGACIGMRAYFEEQRACLLIL